MGFFHYLYDSPNNLPLWDLIKLAAESLIMENEDIFNNGLNKKRYKEFLAIQQFQ
jgi:hypothetical protein